MVEATVCVRTCLCCYPNYSHNCSYCHVIFPQGHIIFTCFSHRLPWSLICVFHKYLEGSFTGTDRLSPCVLVTVYWVQRCMNVFYCVVTERRCRPIELLLRSVEVLVSYLCPKTGYPICFLSSVPPGKLLHSASHYATAVFKFTIRCHIHVVWATDPVIK